MNDNRNYSYGKNSAAYRDEYQIILDWIPKGSFVIDLGCGDGSLLKLLKAKGISGEGVELSESGITSAKNKGLKVKQGRIDILLPYKDQFFDFAVCNVTLQMVLYPEILLLEMKRIAKKQIVSFPNFAFIFNRLDLLINGRMPRIMIPGYEWYSTGHIHQLSIRDFRDFCKKNNFEILEENHIYPKQIFFIPKPILKLFANMCASSAIFLTKSK